MGKSVKNILWDLVEQVGAALNYEVVDVVLTKEGPQRVLRVFIDRPEGIGVEDCEAFSQQLSTVLDEQDPISTAYLLEVSSPGLERPLTKPEHFQRFAGARVRVKLIRPGQDGRRELTGTLLSCEDSVIRLRAGEEELIAIPKKDTSSVRLLDDELVEE